MKNKPKRKVLPPVKLLVTLQHPDNVKADWVTYVRLALVGMMIPIIKVEEYKPKIIKMKARKK